MDSLLDLDRLIDWHAVLFKKADEAILMLRDHPSMALTFPERYQYCINVLKEAALIDTRYRLYLEWLKVYDE